MQIFYINLDREDGRRAHMEAQLARTGLEAERLSAIVPEMLPAELLREACSSDAKRHVSPAELACTMSHRSIWQKVIDRNLPRALVLEDDGYLSPQLGTLIAALEPYCSELDIIRIETRAQDIRLGPATSSAQGIELRALHSVVWGTGGYIVTRAGAERLLGPLRQFDIPVDQLLFDHHVASARSLRTRQSVPAGVANGEAARMLQGDLFESAIEGARRTRAAPPAPFERATANARIRWGSAWLRLRNAARRQIDRRFRGIEVMDIPLL